jgi:rhamnose utilization protein RhaD (predicted bifunctional aldolase and dehydrogenase)
MKSRWVEGDAEALIAQSAKSGIDRELALRTYTTRLLGRDPKLVLHGGGNTSLKTRMTDLFGEQVEVLRIKASGAEMAAIEPAGLPVVRIAALRRLRALDAIDDEVLVGIERANLIDPAAPNPSVEIMLHAFLPHKFVDHTHATAVLSLIDQPDGEAKCAEVYKGRMGFVPYLMPGFGLARQAIEAFERGKPSNGLILSKHGIVTFGESAREAYERMIEMVSLAEDFIARRRKAVAVAAPASGKTAALAAVAPIVRGACSLKDEKTEGAWRRLVLEFRSSAAVLAFLDDKDLGRLGESGVITPDHTIRCCYRLRSPASSTTSGWPPIRQPHVSSRATANISRGTTPAPAAADGSSIPCPASCSCRPLACSVLAVANKMPRSPWISPRRGSKA